MSATFCISVSVFGAFLITERVIQWVAGEVTAPGGIAIVVLGLVVGYFLGIRPLWNQFVASRR